MRISQKMLETSISNINHYTNHKVAISFTQGCGVYLTIDGTRYDKVVKGDCNCRTGITNKKAYELLAPLDEEVRVNYFKNNTNQNN